MPRRAATRLTELAVERAKPPARGQPRVEFYDAALPGFGLRVSPEGTKSWFVFYRFKGRLRRQTLGRYPVLKLGEARQAARAALQDVQLGRDPMAERGAARQQVADTFAAVLEEFVHRHIRPNRKARSGQMAEQMLRRELLPHWGSRTICSITRRDLLEVLNRMADRGAAVAANRLLAEVRKLFNWALERGIVDASPVRNVNPAAKEAARDRVLSDAEIEALWKAWGPWAGRSGRCRSFSCSLHNGAVRSPASGGRTLT